MGAGRLQVTLSAIALGAVATAMLLAPANDVVIYNGSGSMQRGFYIRVADAPARGAVVTVRARDVAGAC